MNTIFEGFRALARSRKTDLGVYPSSLSDRSPTATSRRRPHGRQPWATPVAISVVAAPRAGLALLQELGTVSRMTISRRFHAVRAHLLEQSGDEAAGFGGGIGGPP